MNFAETFKLAFAAIWAHKLRSFLTLLGMIIGVTAFMVVLSLLQGFNTYVDEKIAGIGSNSFTIRRFSFEDFQNTDTIAEAQRRNKELTFDELEFIRERAQAIDKIGAKALPNTAELKRGAEILQDVTVDGVEPDFDGIMVMAYDKYNEEHYMAYRSGDVWGSLPLKTEGTGDNKTFVLKLRNTAGQIEEKRFVTFKDPWGHLKVTVPEGIATTGK